MSDSKYWLVGSAKVSNIPEFKKKDGCFIYENRDLTDFDDAVQLAQTYKKVINQSHEYDITLEIWDMDLEDVQNPVLIV